MDFGNYLIYHIREFNKNIKIAFAEIHIFSGQEILSPKQKKCRRKRIIEKRMAEI